MLEPNAQESSIDARISSLSTHCEAWREHLAQTNAEYLQAFDAEIDLTMEFMTAAKDFEELRHVASQDLDPTQLGRVEELKDFYCRTALEAVIEMAKADLEHGNEVLRSGPITTQELNELRRLCGLPLRELNNGYARYAIEEELFDTALSRFPDLSREYKAVCTEFQQRAVYFHQASIMGDSPLTFQQRAELILDDVRTGDSLEKIQRVLNAVEEHLDVQETYLAGLFLAKVDNENVLGSWPIENCDLPSETARAEKQRILDDRSLMLSPPVADRLHERIQALKRRLSKQ